MGTVRNAASLLVMTCLLAGTSAAQDGAEPPAPPADPRKAEADIAAAQAGARKAQAEARKAEIDAYGSLSTAAGTRGTATVNAGAGAVEATAAASVALDKIADRLNPEILKALAATQAPAAAAALPSYCDPSQRNARKALLVVADGWEPDTGLVELIDPALTSRAKAAGSLKSRADAAIKLIEADIKNVAKPRAAGGSPAGGVAPGLVLAGASALMTAIKTDVDLYGVALTSGDSLLLRTVAGKLKASAGATPVYVPAVINPSRGPAKALLRRVADFDGQLGELLDRQAQLAALSARVTSSAAAAGDKTPLALAYGEIGKSITAFKTQVDSFVTTQSAWLATLVDSSKGKSLAQIAGEQAELGCIAADGGLVVHLKADVFGGSTVTRRNFWTNFGGTPIFVSAGGVVTFSFTDLQTGDFLNSGVARSMSDWTPIIQAGPRGKVTTVNLPEPDGAAAGRQD